jgi:hypothetical protein
LNDSLEVRTPRTDALNLLDTDRVANEHFRSSLLAPELNVFVNEKGSRWTNDNSNSQSGYGNFPPGINQSIFFKMEIYIRSLTIQVSSAKSSKSHPQL